MAFVSDTALRGNYTEVWRSELDNTLITFRHDSNRKGNMKPTLNEMWALYSNASVEDDSMHPDEQALLDTVQGDPALALG
jgi:hypothetical protein